MQVTQETMPEVRQKCTQMINGACARAVELHAPGLGVEFELLPDLTLKPEWGAAVTKILRDAQDGAAAKHGLKTGLRVTPNDIREFERPPHMRNGPFTDEMFCCFDSNSQYKFDMFRPI